MHAARSKRDGLGFTATLGRLREAWFRDVNAHYRRVLNYAAIDRFTIAVILVHAVLLFIHVAANAGPNIGATNPSPFAWGALPPGEAAGVLFVGVLATFGPLYVRLATNEHHWWRAAATVGLTTFSFLFMAVSRGSIEMHFHLFIIMAYLAIYADWRLGWITAGMATVHHGLMYSLHPEWLFVHGRNAGGLVLHVLAIGATAFLTGRLAWTHRANVDSRERARESIEFATRERRKVERALQQAREELLQSERMSALGQLVSGVAHEIRTPLAYTSNYVHVARSRVERAIEADALEPETGERLLRLHDGALDGVERCVRIVEDLRRYARPQPLTRESAPLEAVAQEAVRLFEATQRGVVAVRTRWEATTPVAVDRLRLQQALLNLMTNASEAAAPEGRVLVGTRTVAGAAEVYVEDDGPGVPETIRGHVFEPMFTTKHEGTGLGLSIVRRIVEEHGGQARIETPMGGGARFVLRFPEGERSVPVDDGQDPAAAASRAPEA